MALTNEDLQAIAAMMDKKFDENLKPLKTEIQEMKTDMQGIKTDMQGMKTDIQGLSNKIEMLEIKQDITTRKLEDINFRLTSLEYTNKKEFAKTNDEMETLIAVLEAKNILPKQA